MNVYIVIEHDHEDDNILAVYENEEDAMEYAQRASGGLGIALGPITVDTHEVK